MRKAALRFAFAGPLLIALLGAAEPAPRLAPTRPVGTGPVSSVPLAGKLASLPVTRIAGVEFVPLREGAALLGLKATTGESPRKLILTDQSIRVELETESREIAINGLRLFLGNPTAQHNGVLYISRIDFERCLVARLRPVLLGSPLGRPKVIALDPGHGGVDNGMENKQLGLKEKVLTLDVAQRLKKTLEARGYKVVLTRNDDRQLGPDKQTDWQKRSEVANRAAADLLISIHFNSLYPDTKTSGTETYAFTPQSQRSTRAWSPGENDDTEREPVPVNRFDVWSALLAQSMHREVIARLKTLDRGQKTMHSAVLRGLNCPGVLVESVFLSNDGEAKRAATTVYRQEIAEALAAGIGAYVNTLETLRPKPAPPRAIPAPSSNP